MLAGVGMQDRTDRRVQFRIHEHDRLPVLERLEQDLRAELDRAGHVDEDVDLLGLAEKERVVRHDRTAGFGGVLDFAHGRRDDHVILPE